MLNQLGCLFGISLLVLPLVSLNTPCLVTCLTPLHIAAARGHNDCVLSLIKAGAGAGVNLPERDGDTPLHLACRANHLTCARLLIQHGADVNRARHNRNTPLHTAAWNGHQKCVDILLSHGADPFLRSSDGSTALHDACWGGHKGCIHRILNVGRTLVNARITNGSSPLQILTFQVHKTFGSNTSQLIIIPTEHIIIPDSPKLCSVNLCS